MKSDNQNLKKTNPIFGPYNATGTRTLIGEDLVMALTYSKFGLPPGIYTYDAYQYLAAVQLPTGMEGKPWTETSANPLGYDLFSPSTNTYHLGITYSNTTGNILIMATVVIHIKKQNNIWPVNVWTPFYSPNYQTVTFQYKYRDSSDWRP